MKKTLIVGALLFSTAAFAQEKTFKLELPASDINTISEGLNELPYKKVAPLMSKLQLQINSQLNQPDQKEIPKQETPTQPKGE